MLDAIPQVPGAVSVDLAGGRATLVHVDGAPAAALVTSADALNLQPADLIALARACLDALARIGAG